MEVAPSRASVPLGSDTAAHSASSPPLPGRSVACSLRASSAVPCPIQQRFGLEPGFEAEGWRGDRPPEGPTASAVRPSGNTGHGPTCGAPPPPRQPAVPGRWRSPPPPEAGWAPRESERRAGAGTRPLRERESGARPGVCDPGGPLSSRSIWTSGAGAAALSTASGSASGVTPPAPTPPTPSACRWLPAWCGDFPGRPLARRSF